MNALSRKLHELEKRILDFKVEDGTTIISSQCMNPGGIEINNKAIKLLEARKSFVNELLKKLESDSKVDVSEIARFFTDKEMAFVFFGASLFELVNQIVFLEGLFLIL